MARQPPKCCCCVPLRPGLLAWAYIKLALALTAMGGYVYLTWHELRHFIEIIDYEYLSTFHNPFLHILQQLLPLGAGLLYLVFAIIFATGVHRRNYKLLLVFLVYSIFEVILASVFVGWQVYDLVRYISYYSRYNSETYKYLYNRMKDPDLYFPLILPAVVNILLPIYFGVLIKREVQRLKRARGETRVVLDVPATKEQDKTYNFVYSNGTPVHGKPLFPVEELERLRQQLGVKKV